MVCALLAMQCAKDYYQCRSIKRTNGFVIPANPARTGAMHNRYPLV